MAGKGSAPGERRGGRKKGVPNKATWAKAEKIQAEAKKSGKPIAVDVLEASMLQAMKMAQRYQFTETMVKNKKGKEELVTVGNEPLFGKYLSLAIAAAGKLAPYQSPTLQSTTLRAEGGSDGKSLKVEVEFV